MPATERQHSRLAALLLELGGLRRNQVGAVNAFNSTLGRLRTWAGAGEITEPTPAVLTALGALSVALRQHNMPAFRETLIEYERAGQDWLSGQASLFDCQQEAARQ